MRSRPTRSRISLLTRAGNETEASAWDNAYVVLENSPGELIRTREARVMELPARAGVSQTAEYHFGEDFRGHVTTTPLGIEILGRRRRDHFIHRFSCCDQVLDPLPNLHQHVTVTLQICTCGDRPMSWDDLGLRVRLRQNAVERTNHAID